MIKIEFTEEEQKELNYERFNSFHHRVAIKMEILYLKSLSMPINQIAKINCISENTVRQYLREYQLGGIEKLKEVNFYKPESKLLKQKETIEAYLKNNPPASISEAQAKIEELTGIKRSPTQIRIFLKKLGVKRRKVGVIPGKAITDEKKRAVRI